MLETPIIDNHSTLNAVRVSNEDLISCITICLALSKSKNLHDFEQELKRSFASNIELVPLEFSASNVALVETSSAFVYAINVPISSVPWFFTSITPEFHYGGYVHPSFVKVAKDCDIKEVYKKSCTKGKQLIICGHSFGGSIGHLCALELFYDSLPRDARDELSFHDLENRKEGFQLNWSLKHPSINIKANRLDVPNIVSIGFGSALFASAHINDLLSKVDVKNRILTVVNDHDFIPGMLNSAQAALLLHRTSERTRSIAKTVMALCRLLPQGASLSSSSPTYVSLSWIILQRIFRSVEKEAIVDFAGSFPSYFPCGDYIHLCNNSTSYVADSQSILKLLSLSEINISGNSLLQHHLTAYEHSLNKLLQVDQINERMSHYERLSVPKEATEREIKIAYRSKAMKWHPDKWSGKSLEEKQHAEKVFKLLAEAYEILSDFKARKEYDSKFINEETSFGFEFFASGKINEVSLDDALDMFSKVKDECKGTFNYINQKFGFSTGSIFPQAAGKVANKNVFTPGNHNNIFAQNKMRILQEDKVQYVDAETFDTAAAGKAKVTTVNLRYTVGGAIALGGAVALAVAAWKFYGEAAKKKMQAEAVRTMPSKLLMYLLQDFATSKQNLDEEIQQKDDRDSTALLASSLGTVATTDGVDDEFIEQFYDCIDAADNACTLLEEEELFFDCVALESQMLIIDSHKTGSHKPVLFPKGAVVSTSQGLGLIIESVTEDDRVIYTVQYDSGETLQLESSLLKAGASIAVSNAKDLLELKRLTAVEKVIKAYHLSSSEIHSNAFYGVANATSFGAVDSGVKATGGVVIAKGLGRISSSFTGSAAAPLALASILVDIGRDYLEFKKQYRERDAIGMSTEMEEHLMMQDFRLNVGHHVVSGSAAAAGAGIGAYTTTVFGASVLAGSAALVTSTCAAVVGGVFCYLAASKLYTSAAKHYFTDIEKAKEDLYRLEIGAKVLFDEYDVEHRGYISPSSCRQMILSLQERSQGISPETMEKALEFLDEEACTTRPVTWRSFWSWISTEALSQIERLETMSSSLARLHNIPAKSCLDVKPPKRRNFVELVQLDCLVENGALTNEEATRLLEQLENEDVNLSKGARATLNALLEAQDSFYESSELKLIKQGFEAEDDLREVEKTTEKPFQRDSANYQLDVFCSLLSDEGLRKLVQLYDISVDSNAPKEELHYALLTYGEAVGYDKLV